MKRWECQLLCCVLCSITERICGNDGYEVLFNWKALLKFILKSLLWISQSIVIPLSNLPVQLSIIWHQMFNGTVWSSMICRWLSSFKRKIWKSRLSCRSAIKTLNKTVKLLWRFRRSWLFCIPEIYPQVFFGPWIIFIHLKCFGYSWSLGQYKKI